VQVWQLGGRLTVFALEGEPCSPWGPRLRATAPTVEAMVIGYSNDVTAYIPDARIVREGGYEGGGAQKYFLPGPFTERIEEEVKAVACDTLNGLPGPRNHVEHDHDDYASGALRAGGTSERLMHGQGEPEPGSESVGGACRYVGQAGGLGAGEWASWL